MLASILTVACLAVTTIASWDGNINFNSPSLQHRGLGLDVAKIQKRTGLVARQTTNFTDSQLNFTHGVASGDPYPNSVILWTRLAPSLASDRSNVTVSGTAAFYNHETEEYIRASKHKVCTQWRITSDANLTRVVDHGTAYTTSDIDFTIKVEAKKLRPFTTYYYQFTQCGTTYRSPIGLAVYSCSNYPNGYFNAYGNAARKDRVDYVIHLGDYIYESSVGVQGRDARATNPSRALLTLYDYRTRIAQYRTDADLQLSHQKFAWIATWDDHEVANNGYRDGFSAMNNTEDSFLRFGGVSVDQHYNTDYIYKIHDDAGRSLMGSQQENWFYKTLISSKKRGAAWRIIGNQIVFSRINITSWFGTFENPYNEDQWDGYAKNRARTFQTLYDHDIGNNIMLAGDSHANWVSDLVWLEEHPYDSATGEGAVGVEFAGTAVTSSGFGGTIQSANNQSSSLVRDNSELQWNEGYYRGYYELQIGYDAVHASYYGMPTVATRNPLEISLANFTVVNGGNKLQRPVAGGKVESGFIKTGQLQMTNLTYNTQNQSWAVRNDFNQMFISYPRTT
ncbi:hypothetical protein D6C89_04862 [Aureobasidium pullulans]|nr:hypothetical protein D6C89_04862 [Aureobasidium pullulans]